MTDDAHTQAGQPSPSDHLWQQRAVTLVEASMHGQLDELSDLARTTEDSGALLVATANLAATLARALALYNDVTAMEAFALLREDDTETGA